MTSAEPDATRTPSEGPLRDERAARRHLERTLFRARLNLWWEEAWRRFVPVAAAVGLFVAVSWLGLWRITTMPVRYALLAAFALTVLYLAVRLVRTPAPDRDAALARVEAASAVEHRPARAFDDALAAGDSPEGRVLWRAHRERLLSRLKDLRPGRADPRIDARDPYALRIPIVLLLVIGFAVAGPERLTRIGEAFRGGETASEIAARTDAWVTPPDYTGEPPIFLTGDIARPDGTNFTVPAGSRLIVRTGSTGLEVVASDAAGIETLHAPAEVQVASADGAVAPLEHRIDLDSDQTVSVRQPRGDLLAWRFAVVPDAAPWIAFRQPPSTDETSVSLAYELRDDYGVVAADAELAPIPAEGEAAPRPLYNAPQVPLTLPQLRTREGAAATVRDLSTHPWAGARVAVTLVARDEIDQVGRSATETIRLPARAFGDPLARAVVEQRSHLALDANARYRVADALDALTFGGKIARAGDHLALRSAYRRLTLARDDEQLRAIVDYLWVIALGIEEGDLSPLLRDLQAAQEALRDALREGASEEEIARLTEELRQAMREFLQALVNDAQRNPQIGDLPPGINPQMLRAQDLERMLDRIEELARSGASESAEQLLSDLQNMLENLQAGRPLFGDMQQMGEMGQALNQLGEMIRRQEQLMNETFQTERGRNPEGGEQMTPEQMEEALRQLQENQQALAEALEQLRQQMEQGGMEGSQELGEAGESMGDAAGQLGEGQPGAAVGSQGEALDALRRGTQGLMEQLAEGQQPGPGQQGPGGTNGPNGRPQADVDPLGRPRETTGPDLGTTVKVPDEIDAQRAREILEAIRRRLGDMGRPTFEREYLERLLERF